MKKTSYLLLLFILLSCSEQGQENTKEEIKVLPKTFRYNDLKVRAPKIAPTIVQLNAELFNNELSSFKDYDLLENFSEEEDAWEWSSDISDQASVLVRAELEPTEKEGIKFYKWTSTVCDSAKGLDNWLILGALSYEKENNDTLYFDNITFYEFNSSEKTYSAQGKISEDGYTYINAIWSIDTEGGSFFLRYVFENRADNSGFYEIYHKSGDGEEQLSFSAHWNKDQSGTWEDKESASNGSW